MREIPIDALLSFPQPNYKNPQTRGDELMILNLVLLSLAILTVGLRFYTRIKIQRWFGLDDVFIGISVLTNIVFTTVLLVAFYHYGWNRHVWDIPIPIVSISFKFSLASRLLFTLNATCIRMSLLCFYYRLIDSKVFRAYHYVLHATTAFVVGNGLATVGSVVFECIPMKAIWTFPPIKGQKCVDPIAVGVICGGIMTVQDLIIVLLPIPIVLRLKMTKRTRICTLSLMNIGLVATVAGAMRTWYTYSAFARTWDTSWASYPLWIVGSVEVHLGTICASIPPLRPLFVKILEPPLSRIRERSSQRTAEPEYHSRENKGSSSSESGAALKNGHSLMSLGGEI